MLRLSPLFEFLLGTVLHQRHEEYGRWFQADTPKDPFPVFSTKTGPRPQDPKTNISQVKLEIAVPSLRRSTRTHRDPHWSRPSAAVRPISKTETYATYK